MPRVVPPAPSASLLHGLWFVFHHGGHAFSLWISSFTGKEEFYLDGSLQAERRKMALASDHEATLEGTRYRLQLKTLDLRRGIFQCRLFENDVPVAALETEYVVRRRLQQGAALLFGTAIVLYVVLGLGVSLAVACAAVAALCALVYVCLGRGSGYVMRPVAPLDRPRLEGRTLD